MGRLKASDRARLPDSAFAYIDARGRRRLPIHDEPHVRNALARFGRMVFEDDAARERARRRLLNAAKRYRIVPVGFIDGQLRSEREKGPVRPPLPTGLVTFLFTDIEASTALLARLGDRYAKVLDDVRRIVRAAVVGADGQEVDTRADEVFAVFVQATAAVQAAVAVQRAMADRKWPDQLECRVRIGIHTGRPTLRDGGYLGLSVHTAARVCSAAHGGQILVSGQAMSVVADAVPEGLGFRDLGRHRLPGLSRPEPLFQVEAEGMERDFPPLRILS